MISYTQALKQLYQQRELVWQWTRRSIVGQYRQSVLGIGWAILPPFLQMVLFSIVFGGLLSVDTGEVPYPIFSYVALVPWTFFATGLGATTASLLRAKAMISKIYFPRETLIISAILSNGVNYLVSMVIVVGMLLLYGYPLQITILALPLLLLVQFLLMLGVSFFTATISIFFRDISFAINYVLQAMMYLTPVLYPLDVVPEWAQGFLWVFNPMASIIEGYRRIFIEGAWPPGLPLLLTATLSILLCLLGYNYFKQRENLFPDII